MMKNLEVSCPYCAAPCKLTVFQDESDEVFKVICRSCGREFNIDSTGKIAGTTLPPGMDKGTRDFRPPPGRGPPAITHSEKEDVEKLIEEIKDAEKDRELRRKELENNLVRVHKTARDEPGDRDNGKPPMKTPEKTDGPYIVKRKPHEIVHEKPHPPDDVSKRQPGQGSGNIPVPPGGPDRAVDGPHGTPGERIPPDLAQEQFPVDNRYVGQGYPPGHPGQQAPHGVPFYPMPGQYTKIPFFRNPDWAGKFLIISAILGIVTGLIFSYAFYVTFNGQFEDLTLEGTVRDIQGDPIEGVNITLVDGNRTIATDHNGKYTLEDLDSGTHDIRITAEGYRTVNYRFTLVSDGFSSSTTKDFTLKTNTGNATDDQKGDTEDESWEEGAYFVPSMMIVFSVISFLGGICALKKKFYYFCLSSTVAGFFSMGLVIVSPILSVLAFIILLRSKYAFHTRPPEIMIPVSRKKP